MRGACEESELISALKNAGLATDQERLDEYADRFLEHIEHIQEVRARKIKGSMHVCHCSILELYCTLYQLRFQ